MKFVTKYSITHSENLDLTRVPRVPAIKELRQLMAPSDPGLLNSKFFVEGNWTPESFQISKEKFEEIRISLSQYGYTLLDLTRYEDFNDAISIEEQIKNLIRSLLNEGDLRAIRSASILMDMLLLRMETQS